MRNIYEKTLMKKDYTKTDRILLLIQALAKAPMLTLSEARVKSIIGDARSSLYRNIKEFTEDVGARKAIFIKKKDEEGNISYQLNQCDWLMYVEGKQQLEFVMNTYRELGHLFPKFEVEGFQSNSKNLDRKFYYLCKNKIKSGLQNNHLEQIMRSLIGNYKLLIDYKGLQDEKKKTIDIYPLTLTQYRDDLYLVAMKNTMGDDNLRVYKVSRIEKIQELKEKFKYPNQSKWDPKKYFEKTSGIINGQAKKARFKVFGDSRKILSEKQIFDMEIISSQREFDQYECTYTNIEEFLGILFIYGQDIEIVSDDILKKAFREKAEKIIRRNK